eukprot:1482527-Rhodomonas_salina.5
MEGLRARERERESESEREREGARGSERARGRSQLSGSDCGAQRERGGRRVPWMLRDFLQKV